MNSEHAGWPVFTEDQSGEGGLGSCCAVSTDDAMQSPGDGWDKALGKQEDSTLPTYYGHVGLSSREVHLRQLDGSKGDFSHGTPATPGLLEAHLSPSMKKCLPCFLSSL